MATPILRVPVDDAAFQKFMTSFKKFQAALGGVPDTWKDINAAVDDNAEKSAAAVSIINLQINATERLKTVEDKREETRKKRAKDQENEERAQAEREKALLQRRQDAIKQFQSHAENVSTLVRHIGEGSFGGLAGHVGGGLQSMGTALAGAEGAGILGGLGGTILAGLGMTLGLGAAAVGGAYMMAGGVADRFRTAGGLGISTGELQGTQSYLGPAFGDTAGMMDRLMRAKYSPSQQGTLSLLGINPTGKDAAQMLPEAMVKARRFFLSQGKNMDVMNSTGVLGLFSPEELMNSTQFSEADILGKGKRSAEWAKKNGVGADASKTMINFVSNVDAATDALKNKFVNMLGYAMPVLNNLIQKLNDLGHDVAYIEPYFGKLATLLGYVPGATGAVGMVLNPVGTAKELATDAYNYFAGGGKGSGGATGSWGGSRGATGSWGGGSSSDDFNGSVADRNNNPGNIMRNGKFLKFPTLEAGFAAQAHQLLIDYNRHGLHSVYDLIDDPHHGWANEWAPGNSHASTMNYIDSISKALGVKSKDVINLNDAGTLKKFLMAQRAFERGSGSGTRHKTNPKHANNKTTIVIRDQGSSVPSKVNAMV